MAPLALALILLPFAGRLRRMGAAGAAFVRQEYNMDRISCLVDKAIRRSLIGHESPAAVVAGA